MSDNIKEECGVIGVSSRNANASEIAFFGLHALQHRGQDAAGIAVSDGQAISCHKDKGLITQVFKEHSLDSMKGPLSIGHTRYATTGSNSTRNVQPYVVETSYGPLAVAHNGNLTNVDKLRDQLLDQGSGLQSSSDSEVMALMMIQAQGDIWEDRLANVMGMWEGAFSLVMMCATKIIAVRDPWGFRPLSYGKFPSGGHAVASETGALETIGCKEIKEVNPGEIVVFKKNFATNTQAVKPKTLSRCTFEHIYFSRPDAIWDGLNVHSIRQSLGKKLAEVHPIKADIVIPVPDSSMAAAIGYSKQSGIPYTEGFLKNRYIGRTFIQPTNELRQQGVALKFNVLRENVRGKSIVVVDDSIVRGNTSGPLVKMLRETGAKEIHMRISCPPIKYPCYFGVAMGSYDELIAHHLDVESIRKHINADSLGFLSVSQMMSALKRKEGYCNACFTGEYPVELPISIQDKNRFDKVLK